MVAGVLTKSSSQTGISIPETTSYGALQKMGREELLSTFTPTERREFDEMEELWGGHVSTDIRRGWEIGQRLSKLLERASADKKKYGSKIVERFAAAMGQDSPNVFYAAVDVYDVWNTKDALNEVLKMGDAADFKLTWLHLVIASRIGSKKSRDKFIARILKERLSTKQAQKLLTASGAANRSNNPAGRTPAIPQTVGQALGGIRESAFKFTRMKTESWAGIRYDFFDQFEKMPAGQITPQLIQQVDETEAQVDMMMKAASDLKERLQRMRQHFSPVVDSPAATPSVPIGDDAPAHPAALA